ncbi:DUF4979 domain-containing protein [Prevotella sp.]|uniref:DUF4979 domain-containing protein n=1 Tax=Prevotella sp. TaxID=59823 RepID=UPI00307B5D74
MKCYNKIYTLMLTLGLTAVSLTSCSDDNESSSLYPAVIPAKVEFNLPEAQQQLIYTDATGAKCLPMVKGETLQLNYTMTPEDVTYSDVIWSASNADFATVSDQGLVTAVNGDGYSVVQVAPVGLHEGSGINANLKVVVSAEMHKATAINVTSTSTEVYAGDTLHFCAFITPDNSTYKTVKWSVDNEAAASIDPITGILTAKQADAVITSVKVIATALDGSGVVGEKSVNVKKIVAPESVAIDQAFSAANGYECALNEQTLNLAFTTVPAECTTSLLKWTSSDESIATVDAGVVSFKGFGKVTITAATPDGKTSSIELNIPCGLVRETFRNESHYSLRPANSALKYTWGDGFLAVTTAASNATTQRADLKWYDLPLTLHAGNYPVLAIKMEDAKDLGIGVTSRNINVDVVGKSESGKDFKALGGGNNKWSNELKCADGSRVFIYDLSKVAFKTGGLAPTNESISFSIFQFKYADIKTIDHSFDYKVYWMQTFKSVADVENYVKKVDGIAYEVIK